MGRSALYADGESDPCTGDWRIVERWRVVRAASRVGCPPGSSYMPWLRLRPLRGPLRASTSLRSSRPSSLTLPTGGDTFGSSRPPCAYLNHVVTPRLPAHSSGHQRIAQRHLICRWWLVFSVEIVTIIGRLYVFGTGIMFGGCLHNSGRDYQNVFEFT